jgi:signal transduction histidine kinase
MPEPVSFSTANGMARHGEYRWIECRGIVREASTDGTLKMISSSGEISVSVDDGAGAELARYVDALVRVRGVLVFRESKAALVVPSTAGIEILEPAPKEPFAIPTIAIDKLKDFSRLSPTCHRVKISGVVTYNNDKLIVVQDGSGGVRLKTLAPPEISVGDSVEAAGFPDEQSGYMSLSQALVQKIGIGSLPDAVPVSTAELYSGNYGAQIVRLSGELLEQKIEDGIQMLELQSGKRVFRASLLDRQARLKSMPVGSQVQVTGISWTESAGTPFSTGEARTVSFNILLRTPEDAVILQLPPWWALKHATMIIGVLGFVLVVAMLWIRYLRLKVVRRTQELNVAMTKLERETETSATLAERDRLAGEIHDSLEQGLSAIMMQMEAAAKLVHQPEEVGRYLAMARNMAGFSRTEVQHAVWDLQSPLLENADLGIALHRVAREISAGDTPRVTVQISGEVRPLPSSVEHHLLRIGQEAITNAVKHAQPKVISLTLDYQTGNVTLTVHDDGCGFDPQAVAVGGGHFGLQGLRVRARKMNASLTVSSKPGEGTNIQVVVPLENSNPNPQT